MSKCCHRVKLQCHTIDFTTFNLYLQIVTQTKQGYVQNQKSKFLFHDKVSVHTLRPMHLLIGFINNDVKNPLTNTIKGTMAI